MSDYREFPPCQPLSPFVSCYWARAVGALRDAPFGFHRVLPDGAIDIVFDLRAPAGQAAQVVGTMTRPLLLPRGTAADFLGVRFRPGRAAAFLRTDAWELTDRRVDLAELWSGGSRELLERLAGERLVAGRLRVLERELLRRLRAAGARDPYVDAAVDLAIRRGGRIELAELERRTGVSGVWLRRGFKRHVGTGPKFFCRVVRLKAVVACVPRSGRAGWGALAAQHEFADQSHLAREFASLAGLSPTRFLSEERSAG